MSATYIHTNRKPGFSRIILRSFAILYFVCLAATLIYLWLFTQDRFITIADFKISTQDSSSSASSGMVALALPGLTDSGAMDSYMAIGFINSSDLLLDLEKEYKLVEHYCAPSRDIVFRMPPDYTLEERLKYYRSRIYAHYDKDTGLTELTVDTFKAELSKQIAATILKKTEAYMNASNQKIADQQLNFMHKEVERTTKLVNDTNNEIISLQNDHNFISPDDRITSSLTATTTLRMQYLQAEAQLSAIQRDSPKSPLIESIRSQMRSLNELIDIETAKLSGPEKDRLNHLQIQFNLLKAKLDFNTQLQAGAESLLEKTQSSAIAQSRFFSVIQNPYLPQDVGLPLRGYATVTILVLGLLLFYILRGLALSVLEHG